jgi:hypothetical protein
MATNIDQQQRVCQRFGVDFRPPLLLSNVGIALHTLGQQPVNGLRHPEEEGTCGWYIWCGEEMSDDQGFFHPVCLEHLSQYCPEIIPYLGLPPGWRVLLAPGYEDVWFDEVLLDI